MYRFNGNGYGTLSLSGCYSDPTACLFRKQHILVMQSNETINEYNIQIIEIRDNKWYG